MSEIYDAPHTAPEGQSRGHEATDIRVRPFVMVGIGLVVVVAIISLVLWGLFNWANARLAAGDPRPGPMARTTQVPPAPRLQVSPRQEWGQMLAEQRQQLESYGWVDQNAGRARIPIERAMELVLERGLPARAGGPGLEQSPDFQEADDLESEGGQPPTNDGDEQPGTDR